MAYTKAKATWTAADGVSAADLNTIEQGIADALRKDGSEAMTGDLTILKNAPRTHLNRPSGSANPYAGIIVSDNGSLEGYLLWDYTNNEWVYMDSIGTAFKIWHAGNDGNGSTMDTDLVRGKVALAADGTVAMTGKLTAPFGVNATLADNYGAPATAPSVYPVGISTFFANAVATWPDNYGTVQTIKAFNNSACTQYFYPYNVDAPIKYRNGLFSVDTWTAWRTMWDTTQLRDNSGVLEFYTSGAWKAAGGVKSVQRGVVATTAGGTTNVTISSVDRAKAYVNFPTDINSGTGAANTTYAQLTSATNLAIYSSATISYDVSYEVIEFN